MKFVLKRDSKLEPFDQERITTAIWKAVKAVGGTDKAQAKKISDRVALWETPLNAHWFVGFRLLGDNPAGPLDRSPHKRTFSVTRLKA